MWGVVFLEDEESREDGVILQEAFITKPDGVSVAFLVQTWKWRGSMDLDSGGQGPRLRPLVDRAVFTCTKAPLSAEGLLVAPGPRSRFSRATSKIQRRWRRLHSIYTV